MKQLLLFLLMFAFTLTSYAQITANPVTGDWSAGATWDGGVVPTASDAVIIPTGAAVTIQSGTNAVAYSVTVNGGGSLSDLGTLTIEIHTVTSGEGRIWMDRNLGASQVATSSTDEAAYGDLYQWGRFTEGHQIRTSGITNTQATTATPGAGNGWDGLFITPESESDWLNPYNNGLWQGVISTNNPCPNGFRLPTQGEWNTEIASWGNGNDNAAGAYASPLKLTLGGFRAHTPGGMITNTGIDGYYWTYTTFEVTAHYLYMNSVTAYTGSGARAYGYSVRCIKD